MHTAFDAVAKYFGYAKNDVTTLRVNFPAIKPTSPLLLMLRLLKKRCDFNFIDLLSKFNTECCFVVNFVSSVNVWDIRVQYTNL